MNFEKNLPTEIKAEPLTMVYRSGIEARIKQGKNLENLDLRKINLSSINIEGQSLRGSDVRGLSFFVSVETITNIKKTDWTDCLMGDLQTATELMYVDAEGAKFGFSESIDARRLRHIKMKEQGQIPTAAESGSFANFNGSCSDFSQTNWTNIDFAGGTGYGANFWGAKLNGAVFDNCDLQALDFSETQIDNLKIIDPPEIKGLIITAEQVSALAASFFLSNQEAMSAWQEELMAKSEQRALTEFFGIFVKEPQ
jgi:hypothetical protein